MLRIFPWTSFFIIFPLILFATIEQISSIQNLNNYFDSADTKTLGVFDIDETLLVPEDPAFQKPNLKKHASIIHGIKEGLPLEHQDLLSNLILTATHSQLIELISPQFIKLHQTRGMRLIALTAAMTRLFENDYLPKMRYQELLRNGIDFSSAFPAIQELHLVNMPMCNKGYPVFYSGVLCSNGDFQRQKSASSKGKALCEFLKNVGWIPNKVIFIDDKLYNLEEMEKALSDFDPTITYQGFHFVGAQSLVSPEISERLMEEKWKKLLQKAKFFIESRIEELCPVKN